MKLFKWVAGHTFNFIGGFIFTMGLPVGSKIFEKPMLDALIFIPTGIILMGVSYYYRFVDKS